MIQLSFYHSSHQQSQLIISAECDPTRRVQSSVAVMRVVKRRRRGGIELLRRHRWQKRWRALVTLCEESKRVDLVYEVNHAGPPTKSKPYHKHPHHHKRVDDKGSNPSSNKLGRLFHRILHHVKKLITVTNTIFSAHSNIYALVFTLHLSI